LNLIATLSSSKLEVSGSNALPDAKVFDIPRHRLTSGVNKSPILMCPSDSTVDHSITFLRTANRNERSFQPWNIIAYPIVSEESISNMHPVVAFNNA
jgi:hypothetical protein